MSYFGAAPTGNFISTASQRVTGSTNNYVDLDHAISALSDVIVLVNSVKQDITNLTFTSASRIGLGGTLVSSDVTEIIYLGKSVATQTPGTGTVTNDMLAGSIAQAKLSDEVINEAKLQISNAPVNGYMLTAQSGNTGGLTWAEAGGGVWELLQSVDASATATVDFTYDFPTTYNNYYIYFNDVGIANNGYLALRANVGGNSGVRDGGNDYGNGRYGRRSNGDNASTDLASGDANYSMINMSTGLQVYSGDWNAQGYLWILNPNDDHYKYFQFNSVYGTSGNNVNNIQGGGVMYQNGNLSRVQFMNENGDNMSGKFRLYGLKNA